MSFLGREQSPEIMAKNMNNVYSRLADLVRPTCSHCSLCFTVFAWHDKHLLIKHLLFPHSIKSSSFFPFVPHPYAFLLSSGWHLSCNCLTPRRFHVLKWPCMYIIKFAFLLLICLLAVVQLQSCVCFFATPWTAAHQSSLSLTIPQSLLKLMFIELVNAIQPSYPLLPPSSAPNLSQQQGFSSESALCIRWPSTGVSASATVCPMNIQDWFSLGLTGFISLLSKDSQESSPAPQFKSVNSLVLSLLYGPTLISIHDYWENCSFDCMDLCQQSNVSAF